MLKRVIAISIILSLFSCVIEIEDEPDYAGTWIKSTGTNSSIRLIITKDSYSASEVLTSVITGLSTSTEIERGTIENPTSTTFTLTKTYELEGSELKYILINYQNPHSVSWSVSGNQLTLVDNINTYTNGTFTKQ